MSYGGKDILIKSIAVTIPVYAMAYFKLPHSLCHSINRIVANFWWGQNKDEQKQDWISWKSMCKGKKQGGLRFRDLESFNHSLLAK